MAEYCYMGLIQQGWTAQQARTILPLDTNTDLVHTAFVEDWMHFFDLRALGTTGKPIQTPVVWPFLYTTNLRNVV